MDILRVKKEDVFIRLFFDSFQGKCRKWIEGFPIRSINSFVDFWHIFLETWMEKEEEFKIEVPSIQGFREWEDMHMDDEVDENFASSLSSYLKSCRCSHEVKLNFLQEFAIKIEGDLIELETQIQSQDLDCRVPFFGDLFYKKEQKVRLPVDICIDNLQLEACIDELGQQTESGFFDPIAMYMDFFFSV